MSIVFAGGVNVNDVGERGRTCVCIWSECVVAPGWVEKGGRVLVMNDVMTLMGMRGEERLGEGFRENEKNKIGWRGKIMWVKAGLSS